MYIAEENAKVISKMQIRSPLGNKCKTCESLDLALLKEDASYAYGLGLDV